ncbi:EF-hand domain-containing protein [Salinisphaera sp. Q1T1-3]|uniref:EF-hand domain-containing protein n=1 Tax=Salinisphaera sp. Q1T1-3 TaxID=2321229 RepID=UPI000E7696DE|nr:EF-hand domain-containing protein [Salinisphaera sp. Q1T1-3]RJS95068.1 hypothetical protein D3260_00470 [Salinisphaera sp. Q1T1-3]
MKHSTFRVLIGAGCLAVLPALAQAAPLTSADTNGDGQISRQEAMAAQDASFKRLDSDNNGMLSKKEFDAGQPSLPDDASDADKQRRQKIVGRWFDRIDADDNGKISPAEYRKAVAPYFDRLDANHDGTISEKEIRDSFEKADQAQQSLEKHGN